MCIYQMFETLFVCCDQEKERMDLENAQSQRQRKENCELVNSEKLPEKKKKAR